MGQGGGVSHSQEKAKAAESTGPLLLLAFRLLWCPPLPWGECFSLSCLQEEHPASLTGNCDAQACLRIQSHHYYALIVLILSIDKAVSKFDFFKHLLQKVNKVLAT